MIFNTVKLNLTVLNITLRRYFCQDVCYSCAMRVAKHPSLQPEVVVQAALELLDAEGLENVTLRRLAARLGVQAPALYWHFRNKQDILDEMAHAILLYQPLADLADPADPGAWADWLRRMGHALREALLSRREGARVVAGAGLGRARALAELGERAMRVLHTAGFDILAANRATFTIITYTFGFVIEEQAEPPPAAPPEALDKFFSNFPMLAAAFSARESTTEAENFDWGLQVILQGLQVKHEDTASPE